MNFTLDVSAVLQVLVVGGLLRSAHVLWRTSTIVERLDERTKQHDTRISTLENR